jgi:hypothetical protein
MARMEASRLEGQIESGSAWIGTPDEINRLIARNVEVMGPFEHASMQVNFTNLDFVEAVRSLRLFARDVLPNWRGKESQR